MKNSNLILLFAIVALVIALFIIGSEKIILAKINWDDSPWETLGGITAKFVLVTALIDTFIIMVSPEPKDKIAMKVSKIQQNKEKRKTLETHQNELRVESAVGNLSSKKLDSLNASVSKLETEILINDLAVQEIRNERRGKIRLIAFVIGLFFSFAGMRFLTEFIVLPDILNKESWNYILLLAADTVLTAALISGGTEGLDRFLDAIRDRLNDDNN